MLSKGKSSQINTAYKKVFEIDLDSVDIEETEPVRIIEDVIFNVDLNPYETDELRSFRLSNINGAEDSDTIREWLAKFEPDTLLEKSVYGKIFEIYKLTKGSTNSHVAKEVSSYNSSMEKEEELNIPTTNEPALEPLMVQEGTNISNNTKNILKEEHNMKNAIEELQRQALDEGVGDVVGSNVTKVSKNDKLAAKKVVENSQSDRINYSKNAKIKQVLVVAIDREKKAVHGRASMGTVSKPAKALETFISKTGCSVEDGVIKFSKLHSSQLHDKAVEMYNLLRQAVENPETPVQPYFGKEGDSVPVSIKGVVIDEPDHKEQVLAQKDIASHILNKAFLYLDVESKSKAQFQLDAASTTSANRPKKSYVIRIANKKDLLEDNQVCVFIKNIIPNKLSESKTGFKSALSVACYGNTPDSKGNPKKVTWRIPLEVEQFEVEVVDKYSDLFKTGIGRTVAPISADNMEAVKDISEKISSILASEFAAGQTNVVGQEVVSALNAEKNKIQAAEADVVNGTLGGSPELLDDDEFEN